MNQYRIVSIKTCIKDFKNVFFKYHYIEHVSNRYRQLTINIDMDNDNYQLLSNTNSMVKKLAVGWNNKKKYKTLSYLKIH